MGVLLEAQKMSLSSFEQGGRASGLEDWEVARVGMDPDL